MDKIVCVCIYGIYDFLHPFLELVIVIYQLYTL